MTGMVQEIEILRDVLIAFEEGASDEKWAAKQSLRRLLQEKTDALKSFEQALEEAFDNVPV